MNEKAKKSFNFIFKIVILIILFVWVAIVLTDYFRVRQNKDPMFCINSNVKDYSDGTTTICTGLGYKAIKYERDCISAREFGSIIVKERTCTTD